MQSKHSDTYIKCLNTPVIPTCSSFSLDWQCFCMHTGLAAAGKETRHLRPRHQLPHCEGRGRDVEGGGLSTAHGRHEKTLQRCDCVRLEGARTPVQRADQSLGSVPEAGNRSSSFLPCRIAPRSCCPACCSVC